MTREELIAQINDLDSQLISLCEEMDLYLRESEEDNDELSELKDELENAQFATASFLEPRLDELCGAPEDEEESGRYVTLVQPDGLIKTVWIND